MKRYWKHIMIGVIVVTVIAALSVIWVMINKQRVSNAVANVYQYGELIRSIDLNEVEDSYTFQIEGVNGAYNTVLVEHGYISITDASCPDQVCIHQGKISDGVLPITCLPNQVIIKIESKTMDSVSQLDGKTR